MKLASKEPLRRLPRFPTIRMPATVKADPFAAGFWKGHARDLQLLGRLDEGFKDSFIKMCLIHSRIEKIRAEIERDGYTETGPRGAKQPHTPTEVSLHRWRKP